jgi:hypothetical protein
MSDRKSPKLLEGRKNSLLLLRRESLLVPYWLRPHDQLSSLRLPQKHVLYEHPRRRLYREYHSIHPHRDQHSVARAFRALPASEGCAGGYERGVLQVESQVLAAQNGGGASSTPSTWASQEGEVVDQWT